jgi:predicted phage tail protein
MNYAPRKNIYSEFHFNQAPSLSIDPAVPSQLNISFRVVNIGTSSRQAARVWVYYDNPNGIPITSIDTDFVMGCGGIMDVTFNLSAPPSNVSDVFFRLDTNADLVPNSGDEIKSISTNSARSPAYGEVLLNNRPTFTWDGVAGATVYNLQVSTAVNFSSYVLNITTSSLNYTMTSDMTSNHLMYWRTRAKSGSTYGAWSAVWQFSTANSPSIPSLASPANNSLITIYIPLLDWKDSTNYPHHYQIQIATEKTFSSTGLVKDTTVTGSSYTTETLQSNTLYYWRVRAFNIAGQYSAWSSTLSFRTAILPPTLLSPADGLSLPDRRPPLDWDDVSGANGYSLQISKYSNFSSTVMTGSPTDSKFTPGSNLAANTQLYWRVRAKGTNGPSAWSSVWSFTTANPPGVPSLSSPSNKALTTNYRPKLDWSNSFLPSGTTFDYYQVQVATENTFASPLVDEHVVGLTTSDYTPASDLAPNATYYWRVRAFNTAGQYSAWSSTLSFRTAILPPTLLSPADGSSLSDRRPPLDWDDVSGANGYSLQISKYSNFSSTVMTGSPTDSKFTPGSNLAANTQLYWRVRTKGTNGPSAWSSVWSFTTLAPSAPLSVSPASDALLPAQDQSLAWSSSVLPEGTTFAYYQVQVATEDTFATPMLDVQQQGLDNREYTPPDDLAPDSVYYWRVRAFDTAGQSSDWSVTGSFRIPLTPPILTAPEDGATLLNLRPELDWEDVSGASGYTPEVRGYDVQIATDGDFASPLVSGAPADSTFTPGDDLPANTKLFWRVRAEGASGPGLWSAVHSFTTANSPGVPTLLSPTDGALLPEEHPTLAWSSSVLPEGTTFAYYQMQVATEDTFATPLLDMQ